MIQDRELIFGGPAKSIIGLAAARIPLGGDTGGVDTLKAGDNPGPGALELVISINDTVLAAAGAANVTFSLETKAANADWIATAGTVLWKSAAIAKASLVAGYRVAKIRLPVGCLRYLQVVALPDTNPTTAGKVDAFLTVAAQHNDL